MDELQGFEISRNLSLVKCAGYTWQAQPDANFQYYYFYVLREFNKNGGTATCDMNTFFMQNHPVDFAGAWRHANQILCQSFLLMGFVMIPFRPSIPHHTLTVTVAIVKGKLNLYFKVICCPVKARRQIKDRTDFKLVDSQPFDIVLFKA